MTFYEYEKLAGHKVTEAIDREMSGDVKKGMMAIGKYIFIKLLSHKLSQLKYACIMSFYSVLIPNCIIN